MGVKMEVKMGVMRYAQDNSIVLEDIRPRTKAGRQASLLPWAINFHFYFIL